MNHNKSDCISFKESGIPCEDCDLEGHSALCNWHKDWHDCSCDAFYSADNFAGTISAIPAQEAVDNLIEYFEDNPLVHELSKQNKEMKDLLKLILETDCLPHWAYDKGDDEESIAEMVRKFVKDSK